MLTSGTKFSVLLPILDRADILKGLPSALKSIFENTLRPDQVVVTIDGLVSIGFKKLLIDLERIYPIELVWIDKKVGLDKALNIGLLRCRNEFIFRADGDDINLTDRFETQLPFLLDGYDIVGSNIDEYNEKGDFLCTKKVPKSTKEIKKSIPFRNPINHMTVAYKKSAILSVQGYPELFLKGDYGLWIKLNQRGFKFKNIDRSLVKATTGIRMIRDRGGIKYIFSEFKLQIFLISHKQTNYLISFFVFFLRSLVFILPSKFRYYFYLKFLRN